MWHLQLDGSHGMEARRATTITIIIFKIKKTLFFQAFF